MVTYTIYMKELSASTTWQDITHAVAVDKIPIRKGFGSTADAIDMGSVSLDIHMESLEAARCTFPENRCSSRRMM